MKRLALVLLVACGSSPKPAPEEPPEDHASPPPPRADLWQDGERYAPQGPDDDRFTCAASDDERDRCAAVRPDARCVLDSPPGYWWEIRCKGTAPTEWEDQEAMQQLQSLSVPGCQCTCEPEYYEAADRLDAERERCSRVP